MSISAELGTTLTLAIELRVKLKSQEVTPFHLWAELLAGGTGDCSACGTLESLRKKFLM
jgi:hypothetical protein